MINKLLNELYWDEFRDRLEVFMAVNPEIYYSDEVISLGVTYMFMVHYVNGPDKFFSLDSEFSKIQTEGNYKIDNEIIEDVLKIELEEIKAHMLYFYFRAVRSPFDQTLTFNFRQLEILDGKEELIKQIFQQVRVETNLEVIFKTLLKHRELLKSVD